MPRVVFSKRGLSNLRTAIESAASVDVELGDAAFQAIDGAIAILEHHPHIGRVVSGDLRELVISFGRTGYVALYRYMPARDRVRVLGIRHQRQLSYQ